MTHISSGQGYLAHHKAEQFASKGLRQVRFLLFFGGVFADLPGDLFNKKAAIYPSVILT